MIAPNLIRRYGPTGDSIVLGIQKIENPLNLLLFGLGLLQVNLFRILIFLIFLVI